MFPVGTNYQCPHDKLLILNDHYREVKSLYKTCKYALA